ncbi:MAG: OmpA family protein [Flavobacteriales bacterium]|nr:OmpA family protein [Flavobacteriales bacterium]
MIATRFRILLFAVCLGLYSTDSLAQIKSPEKLSAKKLNKLAANAERYGDNYTALQYYEIYAQKKSEDYNTQYHLAELRESLRDYKGASRAYLNAHDIESKSPDALLNHIRTLKMTGEIKVAKAKYEDLLENLRDLGYSYSIKRELRDLVAGCDTALALMADSIDVIIMNVGRGVNGPHAEFAPIPVGDSVLVYGALKENEIKYYRLDSTTTRRRFYISKKDEDIWQESQEWDVPFNGGEKHVVNGAYSYDGTLFVFTKCFENWKKEMTCELWYAELENDQWGEAVRFSDLINIEDAIVTQPALAFDQRKEQDILYYVSNQEGGQGGMDIYYTYFDKRRGNWRKPRNLGRRINGKGDEITPYYNQKEKKLFFSSTSYTGMGGLDIYSSRGELRRYVKPINVGYPINSSVDDFYYSLREDRESGFFVSNRAGGFQMINETCCDDIYEFRRNDVIKINMEGFVMLVKEEDYLAGEGDKLSNREFDSNFLGDVQVDLYLVEGGNEVLMERDLTQSDGLFEVDFEPEKVYKVSLSKPGFFSNNIDIDTRGITESRTILQNVGLSQITKNSILINNILYDFDSAKLTPESKDKISNGLLNTLVENPGLVVQISSHTDDKGEDAYNLNLSQERAESVIRFLEENGISADRLSARGFGETKPIAPNTNEDGSDNPEGRAMNRRTEFTILDQREIKEDDLYDDEDEG